MNRSVLNIYDIVKMYKCKQPRLSRVNLFFLAAFNLVNNSQQHVVNVAVGSLLYITIRRGVIIMTIGERLKQTDRITYNKLIKMFRIEVDKPKIKLGDSVENLMGHNSYKKVKGRIRQIK